MEKVVYYVKYLACMIFWPIVSKWNMTKKLGHKITWSGWLQYVHRAQAHYEERAKNTKSAIELLNASRQMEEELCYDFERNFL